MKQYYCAITALTDTFSKEKLNREYQQLAQFATAALCRKKPSPLSTGKINTWAAAIIHALGTVNFLFDKTKTPSISASELAEAFSLSTSTVGNKSKQVRELLKMRRFDHHWCLPSNMENSGLYWMIMFNGFIIDARCLPREIQEVAYKKGLIPYIHADK